MGTSMFSYFPYLGDNGDVYVFILFSIYKIESVILFNLFPAFRGATCRRLANSEPPRDLDGGHSKFPMRPKT